MCGGRTAAGLLFYWRKETGDNNECLCLSVRQAVSALAAKHETEQINEAAGKSRRKMADAG